MAGPFEIEHPWLPAPTPFASADDLNARLVDAFNPENYPTEEAIVAEMEAEQGYSMPPDVVTENGQPVPAVEPDEGYSMAPDILTENGVPVPPAAPWADTQMSPEAEAELTGEPYYSQDLTQRQDGFNGQAPPPAPTFGADISLDPSGVINPHGSLSDEELEAVPGAEVIPVQDLTDEALAMRQLVQDSEVEEFKRKREREELEAVTARKVQDEETYAANLAKANQRTEEIFTRSQEIGAKSVDNDRWFSNRSTAGKIGVAISVLASEQLGIISGRGGNEALDFFERMINRDIETQKANIQKGIADLNRDQGIVATLYQQTGDLNVAAQTARLAAYEAGIAKIDSEIARMDPEGTQAVSMEIKKRQLKAAFDGQRAKVAAENRAQGIADAKAELEARDTWSQIQKRTAETAKIQAEAAKLARRGGGGRGNKALSPSQQQSLIKDGFLPYLDANGMVQRDPNFTGAPGDPKEAAMIRKYVADADIAERTAKSLTGTDPMAIPNPATPGQQLTIENGPNKGEAAHFHTEKGRDRVLVQMESTQNLRRAADLLKIAIKEHGGVSELVGSKEYQQARVLVSDIDLSNKDIANLGALTGDDFELLEGMRGGKDPTSFIHDVAPGLEMMAKRAEEKVNTALHVHSNYDGKWKPSRLHRAKSFERSAEEIGASLKNIVPPHVTDPEKRKGYIDNAKTDVDVTVRHKKPSASGLISWAKTIDQQVKDGQLSIEEAVSIVAPMGLNVAKAEQRSIQDTSVGELLKLQKDPGFKQRAIIVDRALEGRATPEDIYRMLVEGR